MEEEVREGGFGDGFWRGKREEGRGIGSGRDGGAGREREERGEGVAAEGVRLVGPVEATWTGGIAGKGVFGLVVVFEDLG